MKRILGSIRAQIIIFVLISLAVMQAALLSNYFQFRELKIQDNRVRYQALLSQLTLSVETSCTYLNDILEQVAYSNEIQAYLESTDIEFRRTHQEQILSMLNSLSSLRSGIKDIAVLDTEGNCTNLNGNIYQIQELANEIPEKCAYYYTGMKRIRLTQAQMVEGFAVGARVYSTSDFTREGEIGTVLITCNVPCVFESAGYGASEHLPAMLVYDRDGKLVFSSATENADTSYELYFDSERQLVAEEVVLGDEVYYIEDDDLEMLGGKILFLISREDTLSGMEALQEQMQLFQVFTAIALVFIGGYLLRRIVHPLNQFMDWMAKLKNGELMLMRQPIQLKGATEVEVMAERFNGMMQEINELTHRLVDTTAKLYEGEIEKRQAELEYMYSQVNPHFLFNTLESVKGCAIEEEADRTFKMVNSLGKIFRYCIRNGDMVQLRDEVSVADSYMYLQQIRFEKRLPYHNRVSDEILEITLPKMILQPLLENAVIHGIEEDGASTVWLDGWLSDGIVNLTVTDDGTGIGKEKMEELQNRLREKDQPAHIGISNIYNRLRYIYGDEYGLELMDMEKGFGIRIRIPVENRYQPELRRMEEGARGNVQNITGG